MSAVCRAGRRRLPVRWTLLPTVISIVWVPVAEYRPGSRSIVYRLDPKSLQVTEAFRVDDHVGGVVRDPRTNRVHGVSWGSRTEYTWTPAGRETSGAVMRMFAAPDDGEERAGTELLVFETRLPG
jgi:hypothetical protein